MENVEHRKEKREINVQKCEKFWFRLKEMVCARGKRWKH